MRNKRSCCVVKETGCVVGLSSESHEAEREYSAVLWCCVTWCYVI